MRIGLINARYSILKRNVVGPLETKTAVWLSKSHQKFVFSERFATLQTQSNDLFGEFADFPFSDFLVRFQWVIDFDVSHAL